MSHVTKYDGDKSTSSMIISLYKFEQMQTSYDDPLTIFKIKSEKFGGEEGRATNLL
jgi:hypothetical protein